MLQLAPNPPLQPHNIPHGLPQSPCTPTPQLPRAPTIVSLDVLNANLQTVTICPVTSQLHPGWRSRLRVRCVGRPAEIAVDQIRTVSKARLGERIGALSPSESASLRRLIAEMYCGGDD
jgi:mRNA interferase MazF